MTPDDVKKLVDDVRASADDDERAHYLEDTLHQDVLRAIAGGAQNAMELATEALRTREIEFSRWYA